MNTLVTITLSGTTYGTLKVLSWGAATGESYIATLTRRAVMESGHLRNGRGRYHFMSLPREQAAELLRVLDSIIAASPGTGYQDPAGTSRTFTATRKDAAKIRANLTGR